MAGKYQGAHPGFQGAARQVARKEGISMKEADKIIGAGKAHASEAARRHNPRLNKMSGGHHK